MVFAPFGAATARPRRVTASLSPMSPRRARSSPSVQSALGLSLHLLPPSFPSLHAFPKRPSPSRLTLSPEQLITAAAHPAHSHLCHANTPANQHATCSRALVLRTRNRLRRFCPGL
uniref:Uncharacterized protein n=1 Tax=Calcidiscus leptoporus TaxID=127549 RepID=A0A7S0IXD4_9EUKA